MKLAEVKNGETFKIGDIEFIKFNERNGEVAAVAKEPVFYSTCGSNNFSKSNIFERIERDFKHSLFSLVGEENVHEHEVDLLALDGTSYGKMTEKVSVPTFDFYRQNRAVFDKHKIGEWWWLATADSINNNWQLCVSPSGVIFYFNCCNVNGVRPFCIFNSHIFIS